MKRRTALASAAFAAAPTILKGAAAEKLKYVQIGIGHPHSNKIEQYNESEDWDVVGIVEEDPELLAKAKEHKTFKKYPFLSLEEALNTPGLSTVGIETEIRDLLKYSKMAIDGGYHIHIDKPAGANLDEYRKLLKTAEQKNLVTQMGYMYRFNPAIELLHRFLEEGYLGEIFETHAVMSKVMPASSRQVIDEFTGGTMFELGCHIIDLTIGVLGAPDKITAFPKRVIDSPDDTLIDNMLAVFEYPKATATVRSTAVEVEGFSRRHFAVCGTEGTFQVQPLDRPSVKVSLSKERKLPGEDRVFRKGHTEIPFGPYQRYAGDVTDLAATIRGEQENRFPYQHDLAVQEAVLKAAAM